MSKHDAAIRNLNERLSQLERRILESHWDRLTRLVSFVCKLNIDKRITDEEFVNAFSGPQAEEPK